MDRVAICLTPKKRTNGNQKEDIGVLEGYSKGAPPKVEIFFMF
jgi:hypothetical protein